MTHKVLLIDDDEDDFVLVQALAEELTDLHLEIDWRSSFEAGLETLAGGGFEACLVDYRMGARTGLDLIHAAAKRGVRIPIILMTGQDDPKLAAAAHQAGAGFLIKGGDAAHLDRALRKAVLGVR